MQAARSGDEPPARKVGVGELKRRADEIIREVRETGRPVDVVQDGQVAARLLPAASAEHEPVARRWTDEERASFWQRIDVLAREISRVWPEGVSAVDAVREQRRDL